MYKFSKYNVVYPLSNMDYLIVNGLYNTKSKIISTYHPKDIMSSFYNSCRELEDILLDNHIIVPEQWDEDLFNQYSCYKRLFNCDTLNLEMIVGNQCNFNCTYCWQHHTRDIDLSKSAQEKIDSFVNLKLRRRKFFNVEWIGGEPLLYQSLIDEMSKRFIEISHRRECYYSSSITTNGFLLKQETQYKMIFDNKIHLFMITVDGVKETHDLLRVQKNGEGTFNIILTIIALRPNLIYPGHGKPFGYDDLKINLKRAKNMELLPIH